jgi:hypothetical protein
MRWKSEAQAAGPGCGGAACERGWKLCWDSGGRFPDWKVWKSDSRRLAFGPGEDLKPY